MHQAWMVPILLVATFVYVAPARAQTNQTHMRVDNARVQVWNRFARDCLDLSKRQVRAHKVRQVSRVGGYEGRPRFYREVSYYDAASGKLLSRVQWERQHPSRLHAIEVYVRDSDGRVVRDYAAAYLPNGRNAPVQTLINLHGHGKGLDSFRQFDASGERIYEYCEGRYQGRAVQIRLFEDDLYDGDADTRRLMASPQYKACFDGVPMTPGKYLTPQ